MKLCLISATDSCNVTLSRISVLASPLESAVTKNASANPLGCAVTKSLDLKSPGMNSYKKTGGSPLLSAFAPLPFAFSTASQPLCGLPFMVYLRAKKEDFNTQAQRTQKTRRKRSNETQNFVDRSCLRSAGDRGQRLERGRETLVGPREIGRAHV